LIAALKGSIRSAEKRATEASSEDKRLSSEHPNPVDKYVGSRVRMRRRMLGMSQERLAEQLGLTFQQVQKYEKGINRISAGRLQQLSHILDVSVSYFFENASEPADQALTKEETPPPTLVTDFLVTNDGQALLKAFMRISDRAVRRSIVRLVEAVTDARRL
jgi:transcriptional regulator with XRE-family HTH domain